MSEMKNLGIDLTKIHSVERLGGGSRIPKIEQMTSEVFGKTISKTLDASESISRGCAI